jgi:hypothetical protein
MINKKSILSVLLLSLLIVAGCKEQETPVVPTPAPTKTALLSASPWITTAITISPALEFGGIVITDLYALSDACDNDNLAIYKNDGTGTYDEGASKCDDLDPQTSAFNWTFNADETQLIEDGQTSYAINELTATTMKLADTIDGADIGGTSGVTYTITITLKH